MLAKILHLDRYCIPYYLLNVWYALESKTIFARKQTRDKQDGGIILNTCCKEKWEMLYFLGTFTKEH
jgi:hypothetical protein